MIITVSGSAGSGKTSLAKKLSEKLAFKHISAGQIMRNMAKEKNISLLEFSKQAEKDSDIDREIDERQKKQAKGNCIIDGRLSAFFLKPDYKIYLTAPLDVRAKRLLRRDKCKSFEEAKNGILKRERSELKRYKKIYGINLEDLSVYDLVLNTENLSEEDTAEIVYNIVKKSGGK